MNRCVVCGNPLRENAELHHIFNRGLGHNGCDCAVNRAPPCDEHHTGGKFAVHNAGRETFFLRMFPQLEPLYRAALEHHMARERGEHLPCLSIKRWK